LIVQKSVSILVVEDDEMTQAFVGAILDQDGSYETTFVTTIKDAKAKLSCDLQQFNAVVLDRGLPDGDGEVVAAWMATNGKDIPVLMLTGSSDEQDYLTGFAAGVLDYVAKPVSPDVLLARLRAATRASAQTEYTCKPLGHWDFRAADGTLVDRRNGTKVFLTPREVLLLKVLFANPNRIVRRQELLAQVWGYQPQIRTHTIETTIYRMRKKIEANPSKACILLSEEGGYRLQAARTG
jgi:DNA-binding response OmpR family regulator